MERVRINELRKFLAEDPDEKTTSYLSSRKTRESEYEDESIPHIDMTSEAPMWEPSETSFTEQGDKMTNFRGEVISSETIERGQRIIKFPLRR